MTSTKPTFDTIASLARLSLNSETNTQLAKEVAAIMNFANRLLNIETPEMPLLHPLDIHQPFRKDISDKKNHLQELQSIAPVFQNSYYLVPQVLNTEK